MGIGRLGQSQQFLQQALDMGGGSKSSPRVTRRHALKSVIHHHRQMIGGGHVLARQHQVAEFERINRDRSRHVRGS